MNEGSRRRWRGISMRRAFVLLGLGAACLGAIVVACTFVVTDPRPHQAALDRVPVPASWSLADSNVVENALLGSRIERYYLVDSEPEQLIEPVREMLVAGGFEIVPDHWSKDWCNYIPLGATGPPGPTGSVCPVRVAEPCSSLKSSGTCRVAARAGGDEVDVVIFKRGDDTNYFVGRANHIVRARGLVIVRVIVSW